MRRATRHDKKDALEMKAPLRGVRHGQMAQVDRVECSAEKADAANIFRLTGAGSRGFCGPANAADRGSGGGSPAHDFSAGAGAPGISPEASAGKSACTSADGAAGGT